MPRTKLDARNKERDRLVMLIRENAFSHMTSISKTASLAGFKSYRTIYSRFKSPDTFDLRELRSLRRAFDISQDDLLEAIKPWI